MKVSQAYNQSKGWLRPWIIHAFFRIHIIGKRFYTRLLAFELNFFIWPCSLNIFNSLCQITQSNHAIFNSIGTNFYTLLLSFWFWYLSQYSTFDWDANFAVWYSLGEFCYSPRHISNSTSYIFNSTLEFSFPLVFGSFVHHALWKKGVCRQHTSFTSCQNAACSFET